MSANIVEAKKVYQCVVFDWDGTLMDSVQKIAECCQSAAADVGLPVPTIAAAKNIIGLGLRDAMLMLFGDISEAVITQMVERYRHHFLHANQTPQPLFTNVRTGLQQLDSTGVAVCVATGKARAGLDRVLELEQLRASFMYTRCADEARSKPHPQMLLDILDHLALPAEKVLMIGDSTYDMEMAVNAGVDVVGVEYGVHSKERLLASGALHTMADFSQLLAWLEPRVETVYQ